MRKGLILWSVMLFLLSASVYADYVIGPPDDPTIIEDSSGLAPYEDINPTPPPLPLFLCPTVNSVGISGLDCSQFPLICMYVDVLDQNGNPMSGMTADSFCVKQDGITIDSFTIQQLSIDSCITSVCLVVDVSGSMADNHKLDSAKSAMHQFVNNMDPYDRVAIVPYSNCIGTITPFTSNKTTLHNAINALTANGYTACYDGIYKGVDLTKTELGSKAVIAFTDGLENRSKSCYPPPDGVDDHKYSDDSALICNLATGAGIPIYTFNLGPIDNTWYNPEALQAFANGTGGYWDYAPTGAELDSLYARIKQRLCSRYYICYNSLDTIQNGDYHASIVCYWNGTVCSPCDTATCQELAAPVIVRTASTIAFEDTCQPDHNNINICAYVTDLDTPTGDLTVTLFYRVTGQLSYTSVSMTASPGDSTFCATVSASELNCRNNLDYYITASDGQATVSSPSFDPQNNPYMIEMCGNNPPVANAGSDQTISQCTIAQICWPAGCSDPDGNLQSCQLISGPGTYTGSQICFTPTGTMNYEFVLKAIDSCGVIDYDTVVIYYSINRPPVADAGRDSTLFLCGSQQICWPAGCSDLDGNLSSCALIAGTGNYNGTNICFTPTTGGTYTFILEATDVCGAKDRDTSIINVSMNSSPVCSAPNDTSFFQCTPTQVSLPYSASDVNGNLMNCQIVSGPGTLTGGNWRYTPSADQTVNVTIRCTDSCGAYCEDQFSVSFDINQAPAIAFGNDSSVSQCAPQSICVSYTVSDPENNATLEQLISGQGTIDTTLNKICFTPTGAGTYSIIARVTDACGAIDYDTINVTVSINQAPTANAGSDQTIFQCTPTQICWPVSCSDIDGNLSTCALISGTGTYNGSNICFTPVGSGTYTFILEATDACGAKGRDTARVTVTLNSPPICNMPPDTNNFSQCSPAQVSLPVGASDPNGNFDHCEIITGPGSLIGGNWIYTPSGDEFRKVVIKCLDQCGAYCIDSFFVSFDINSAPVANAGSDQTLFQCTPTQICWLASCSDPDGNLSNCTLVSGQGSYNGTNICFTPTAAGSYTFILEATDACGATDRDTAIITVATNTPPTANAGSDQNIFQCTPAQICWPVSCNDINGNLSNCALISGDGTYNGSNICFTPTGSGAYTFILEATDACGANGRDTVVIAVTINSSPVCNMPPDTNNFSQCSPTQVSLPVGATDPDGNLSGCQILSGPGSLIGGNWVYTPGGDEFRKVVIKCLDQCGTFCVDSFFVNFDINSAPVANAGADQNLSQCTPTQVCWPASCSDPDGNLSSCALVSGTGTYNGTNICFTPTASGSYTFILEATDACGAKDRDTAVITIALNSPPTANAGADQNVFQCAPAQICWPASCNDIDGNLSNCALISGIGTYNGSNICFTPTGSGSYTFILEATDACGAKGRDTVVVNATINGAPSIAFGNDSSLFLCLPQQICLSYTVSDPQGLSRLSETMISGYGTIDTANNRVCFTPTTTGSYQIIVGIADSCGASDADTVVVGVTFGEFASINCPTNPIQVSLCEPGTVCQSLSFSPSSASISISFGTYSNGQICFNADTSGTYNITAIASASCGADTCQLSFVVDIGEAAQLDCQGTQTKFICQAGPICIPIGVVGEGAVVSVSPIGSYGAGQVCFTADTSGHYVLTVIAETDCGSDTCQLVTDVTINANPVAVNPTSPVDTFICNETQVCYQFAASDVNGGNLTWTKLSGDGAVSSTGQWCFTAGAAGNYTVSAKVSDSCGAADTVSLAYNVNSNDPPSISFGNDTTMFLCSSGSLCFGYTVSDPDNNITLEELSGGSGSIDTVLNKVCFTPPSTGNYQFIIKATDGCGLIDYDTINVTISLNNAPLADAGQDQSLFQCTSTQICWPVSCNDIDGNLTDCALVSGVGAYSGGNICFTPTAGGAYTFILEATDACGAKDRDTAIINVVINTAPVCHLPNDTSFFQCIPTQVCLPVSATDVNGNYKQCQIVTGPGSLSNGNWCYTPTSDQVVTVTVKCEDSCGAYCQDDFTVTFDVNQSPAIAFGNDTTIFQCGSQQICIPYSISDPDNNAALEQLVGGSGTIDTAQNKVCFTPATSGVYAFIAKVTDACGIAYYDTMSVNININHPPVANAGPDQSIFLSVPTQICWPAGCSDIDGNLVSCLLVSGLGAYDGTNICFTPTASGVYTFIIEATDACPTKATARDTAVITVTINEPPICHIPNDTSIFQCNPTQVCLPVSATDANGNFKRCMIMSGPGSLVNGNWCYTPTYDQTANIAIRCEDSCGAYCEDSFTVVFNLNQAPTIAFGNDTTIFQCSFQQVCFNYTVSDPDNNITLEGLVNGIGTIDTALNKVCLTPTAAGTFSIIAKVTDGCGLIDYDTINVTINSNHAPTASAGVDKAVFQCTPAQICWPASCSDIDGNLTSCALLAGSQGTYNGTNICFTPTVNGIYTFILEATDACNAKGRDTVAITVTLNSPPVCNMPPDTSNFLQCTPTQVSLPVSATDPNSNFDHCEIVNGPGSLVGGNWIYTPTVDEFRKVIVKCLDQCGAFCLDSFFVRFDINAAPVANAGLDQNISQCAPSQICWPISCSDVDGNLSSCLLVSGLGLLNGNNLCFTPPAEGNYQFVIEATDACGAKDRDTVSINVNLNSPPVVQGPPDFTIYFDYADTLCFEVEIHDDDNNLSSMTIIPEGSYDPANGQICIPADSSGRYCVIISATDNCGATDVDTVCVDVQLDECIHVQVEKVHNALQGHHQMVDIFLNGSGKPIGGFDFLISYDNSALNPGIVMIGALLEDCGWEYFTYRFGAFGNCGNACPSGMLRIVAMAETNNGAYHPSCYLDDRAGTLASIDFLVSNDRTFECQYVPIRFYWFDCGDNAVASKFGDTTFVSRGVYDFTYNEITDYNYELPGYYGAPDICLVGGGPDKPAPIRCVDFVDGGIDIVCADSIDARGDINLNGIPYEIGDAVVLTNYFIAGLNAFTVNVEGQIAASEVNGDGVILSVADLVYLIRVIIGDVAPLAKPGPGIYAKFHSDGNKVRVETNTSIGAALFIFDGEITPTLSENCREMELKYGQADGMTRVLVYSMKKGMAISTGDILQIEGAGKLVSIDASDYNGAVLKTNNDFQLPVAFSLAQNYPNPFNPITIIEFALPSASDWELDVYNVLGQKVETWNGKGEAGYYRIEWDAGRYASGVYFYRITAGQFTATKKMVLLK
jgi:VWFA-related protein